MALTVSHRPYHKGLTLLILSEQIKQNMRADPFVTKMELADLLQISPRWVARKMKDLQASGEIRRVGADKNGHWEVLEQSRSLAYGFF